jgi:acetyl esterase
VKDGLSYRPTGPLDPIAEQIAAYFGTDPVWQGLRTRPVAETRAAIGAATPMSGQPLLDYVEDFKVPVDAGSIAVRLYRPSERPPALIVWAHGGGFALGSIDEIDNFARKLAKDSGYAVLSVEYRLAPEHRFPAALNDVEAATRWAAERIEQLAGARVPIVLGGDSAGASLATIVTRQLHAAGEVPIAANVLAYPNTDNEQAASLRTFETPFLGAEDVSFFLALYAPDAADRASPDFAPTRAEDLAGLPPTLLITAEHDVLTGQVLEYARKLEAVGVPVRQAHYPGMIHGFVTMDAFFPTAAGEAIREIGDFVNGALAEAQLQANPT